MGILVQSNKNRITPQGKGCAILDRAPLSLTSDYIGGRPPEEGQSKKQKIRSVSGFNCCQPINQGYFILLLQPHRPLLLQDLWHVSLLSCSQFQAPFQDCLPAVVLHHRGPVPIWCLRS